MPVKIINQIEKPTGIKAADFKDGGTYMDEECGSIYIANRVGRYLAFSICGKWVIRDDIPPEKVFREVSLEVYVK